MSSDRGFRGVGVDNVHRVELQVCGGLWGFVGTMGFVVLWVRNLGGSEAPSTQYLRLGMGTLNLELSCHCFICVLEG